MLIYLKGCYDIEGKIYSSLENPKITFNVPIEGKRDVIVDIFLNENRVESFHEVAISNDMLKTLQNDSFFKKDTLNKMDNELLEIESYFSKAAHKIIYLIKYGLQQPDLNENLLAPKGIFWSLDKLEWKIVPSKVSVSLDISKFITLNKENSIVIQRYINSGYEPFVALRHLHRAKKELNPRYKWIDATIALELAIKEFLIIKVPKIEAILLEVPSPPLHKLYGVILEKYTGSRSPRLKEIQNGVEVRNRLVHRPEDIYIDNKEANKYIADAETAIYHLLFMLYPKDYNIFSLYRTHLS